MTKVNRAWNSGSGRKGTGMFKTTMTNLTPTLEDEVEYIKARARYSTYDPFRGSSREYVWTDDAACNGVDPNLFEIDQTEDPASGGLQNQALRKHNEQKVAEAQKVCQSCPVRKRCLEEASPSDRWWSVRGGERPAFLDRPHSSTSAPAFDYSPWAEPFECKKHGAMNIRVRVQRKDGEEYSYEYCEVCNRGG